MVEQTKVQSDNFSLAEVITTAIKIPGVKVVREAFLLEQFKDLPEEQRNLILEVGPVTANVSQAELKKKAVKIVNARTLFSSSASFAAGLPGGLTMAAAIPADILQFYAVALRMAQEIAYLYGEADLWCDGTPDFEKIMNQLVLYCGVMLGASGAAQTVRVVSSALAQKALKTLPQKALTKTFYYPIVKSISKALGVRMTKGIFAKGVSKVVPVVGGVVSGGITLATMKPMGMRLVNTLDKAHFSYEQSDFEADWQEIVEECNRDEKDDSLSTVPLKKRKGKKEKTNLSFSEEIQKAKQLLDEGVISEEEFAKIKAKIIEKI